MTVEELTKDIELICQELNDSAKDVGAIPPVSFQSSIRWSGIIGAVQEVRESKKFAKLLDKTFYKDYTFVTYIGYIITSAEKLIEKQKEVQKLVSAEDERYYGNVRLIAQSIISNMEAWHHYSPDMAEAVMEDEDGGKHTFFEFFDEETKKLITQLDLPPEMRPTPKPPQNSGCLGTIIFAIIALGGGTCYGLYQLLI